MTPKTEKPRAFVSVVSLQMREGPFTGKEQFDEPLDLVEIRAVTELEQRVESLKGLYEVAFTEAAVAEAKVTELEAENQKLREANNTLSNELSSCANNLRLSGYNALKTENQTLAAKLKRLVAHSIETASISKAKGAEVLGVSLIDLDAELAKVVPHG